MLIRCLMLCLSFERALVAFMLFIVLLCLFMLLYVQLRVIRISPFANRLSFDAPPAVQRLRCLANFEALRFSSPILMLGEALVARMKERSVSSGGKYVSVHLRFEEVRCIAILLLV